MIKRILTLGFLSLSIPAMTQAQTLDDLFNILSGEDKGTPQQQQSTGNRTGTTNSRTNTNTNKKNLSNSEIASGLKEALKVGAQNAGKRLSATDGYFGNSLIKILLPPEAQQVESSLRAIGMGSIVDKAILSMNRAAEDAATKAAPIFINAITSMSIQDGINILSGGNNAATLFLKARTTAALTQAFQPVIQNSLNKVGAPEIWRTVFSTYNNLPLAQNKVNPDLTGYVTERALAGLFTTIADEELKIRTNPAARVNDLLKKVFGG